MEIGIILSTGTMQYKLQSSKDLFVRNMTEKEAYSKEKYSKILIWNGLPGASNKVLIYQLIVSDVAAATCYHLVNLDLDTTCIASGFPLGTVFTIR